MIDDFTVLVKYFVFIYKSIISGLLDPLLRFHHPQYAWLISGEGNLLTWAHYGPFSAATRKSPHLFKYLLFAAIHSMSVFVVFIVLVEGNLLIISSEGNLLTWAQLDFLLATDQNAIA